jgi:hypothetical protein
MYILSPDSTAQEEVHTFFNNRRASIHLNMAKSRTTSLQDIRENGLEILGTCVGSRQARERFLAAKIASEEESLLKLSNLPNQHALLVLRNCIQQNLRHLQRSLRSDDLPHLWDQLDTSLQAAVARIQGRTTSTPLDRLESTLINLPVRLGGLGILSYKTCAPLAHLAASGAADATLASILPPDLLPESPGPVLPQRELCREAFQAARDALLEGVDPHSAKMIVEASSTLGRKWLSIIPFFSALRLSDFEISAALHLRILSRPSRTACGRCGATNSPSHVEICAHRSPWTLSRHENAKRVIYQALKSTQGVRAHMEPFAIDSDRRNDLRIEGSQSSGLSSEEIDLSIVSLASQRSVAVSLPPDTPEDAPAAEKASKLIHKRLSMVAARKRRDQPTSTLPFRPVIISLGGVMEKEAMDVFRTWKGVMTGGVWSFLIRRLSLCLLKARVQGFEY